MSHRDDWHNTERHSQILMMEWQRKQIVDIIERCFSDDAHEWMELKQTNESIDSPLLSQESVRTR